MFTSGFTDEDVFTVNSEENSLHGTAPELRIYLLDLYEEYTGILGSEVLGGSNDSSTGGSDNASVRSHIRSEALSRLTRVKALNLMAEEQGVSLTDQETAAAATLAGQYLDSLSDGEKAYLGTLSSEETAGAYRQYMLADRMYDQIISPVGTEISDDEARILTAESILFRTVNDDGTPKSEAEQAEAKSKAEECLERIRKGDGTTFDALISEYSDSDVNTFKICRNGLEENSYLVNGEVSDGDTTPLAETAYTLAENEKSDIIETSLGYRIVKYIGSSDQAETDANKKAIVERRQAEAFEEAISAYEKTLDTELNQSLWAKLTLPDASDTADTEDSSSAADDASAADSGSSESTAGSGFFRIYDTWKSAGASDAEGQTGS